MIPETEAAIMKGEIMAVEVMEETAISPTSPVRPKQHPTAAIILSILQGIVTEVLHPRLRRDLWFLHGLGLFSPKPGQLCPVPMLISNVLQAKEVLFQVTAATIFQHLSQVLTIPAIPLIYQLILEEFYASNTRLMSPTLRQSNIIISPVIWARRPAVNLVQPTVIVKVPQTVAISAGRMRQELMFARQFLSVEAPVLAAVIVPVQKTAVLPACLPIPERVAFVLLLQPVMSAVPKIPNVQEQD